LAVTGPNLVDFTNIVESFRFLWLKNRFFDGSTCRYNRHARLLLCKNLVLLENFSTQKLGILRKKLLGMLSLTLTSPIAFHALANVTTKIANLAHPLAFHALASVATNRAIFTHPWLSTLWRA
jgi:hypothetical protein